MLGSSVRSRPIGTASHGPSSPVRSMRSICRPMSLRAPSSLSREGWSLITTCSGNEWVAGLGARAQLKQPTKTKSPCVLTEQVPLVDDYPRRRRLPWLLPMHCPSPVAEPVTQRVDGLAVRFNRQIRCWPMLPRFVQSVFPKLPD